LSRVALILSAVTIVAGSSQVQAEDPIVNDNPALPFRISILAADGSPIDEFVATLQDMHIDNVKMGPNGNIWLARADNSHARGVPNPNDMVAIFAMDGTEINTIAGGGMRHPLSMAWDGEGNIYINGEDIFFATDVYKYESDGTYVTKFHTAGWTLIDEYNDIAIVNGSRIYVSSWHGTSNDDQMTEFTTSGQTVRTFSPTGPFYFHRDVALGPANTLWVRTPRNGSGDDLIREFDLDGNLIDYFSTTVAAPGSNMRGLEATAAGNIITLNVNDQVLYEMDSSGNVVGTTALQGLSSWITDFTFGPGGVILVANQSTQPAGLADAPPASGLQLAVSPNPFRRQVTFHFTAPAVHSSVISVHDVAGRLVRSYELDGRSSVVSWDGTDASGRAVATGTYFVRLVAGATNETGRVVLLR
jgi:hypothetical protein